MLNLRNYFLRHLVLTLAVDDLNQAETLSARAELRAHVNGRTFVPLKMLPARYRKRHMPRRWKWLQDGYDKIDTIYPSKVPRPATWHAFPPR